MKKSLSLLVGVLACASAFAGANNLRILFSTKGVDTYADGVEVKAGERYALVWKASESDNVVISADGTAEGGKIVAVYATKEDGHCSPVLFQADEDWVKENYNGGVWAVYLLDTRLANGEYSALDKATGLPTVVNASGVVRDSLGLASSGVNAEASSSAVATAVPDGVTAPVVKAIEVKGAFVEITVSNTSPLLLYTLESGDEPGSLSRDAAAAVQNGDNERDITIITPKTANGAFFKVIRK